MRASPAKGLLLVTSDNAFLEGALLIVAETFDTVAPDEYERRARRGAIENYRVIVFDEHTPSTPPPSPAALYFNPTGKRAPFRVVARVHDPQVIAVDERHEVTRFVHLGDASFEETAIFDVDPARGEAALVTTDRGPIIAARRVGGRRVVAFGFGLGSTDLHLRTAFPLLLSNTIAWLDGTRPSD
jgi:Ca-activated chloride channel homolog